MKCPRCQSQNPHDARFCEECGARLELTCPNCGAVVTTGTLTIYRGSLPPRALGMVLEWATLHAEELRQDWELARKGEPLRPIAPLA